jgi:hypothetical protein
MAVTIEPTDGVEMSTLQRRRGRRGSAAGPFCCPGGRGWIGT